MKQIVTKFTDNDLYTFTCQYYVLQTYPYAEVQYTFFDRNHTRYPEGFDKLLQEQVNMMANVQITDEEIEFMKKKVYFLPAWYYVFLKGLRFDPSQVSIFQDQSGYLSVSIKGKWYSAIMWEMPILSIVSELMHTINGDIEKVDLEYEKQVAYNKGIKAFANGLVLADMGTRRRFSFEIQDLVLSELKRANEDVAKSNDFEDKGVLAGTSNVYFAMKYDLKPIGTMSHQIISFEECVSGVHECNHNVMEKWSQCFNGLVGTFLYDTFTYKTFFDNFCTRHAKLYDGLRVDSGEEKEQTLMIIDEYQKRYVKPETKSVTYSNALDIDKAIALHKWVNKRVLDNYGMGTHLMACIMNQVTKELFPYSNIVIKLTAMRLTEKRSWQDTVKLSNDKGKTLGNKDKCEYLMKEIWK